MDHRFHGAGPDNVRPDSGQSRDHKHSGNQNNGQGDDRGKTVEKPYEFDHEITPDNKKYTVAGYFFDTFQAAAESLTLQNS